jgi:hypothetical protein
MYQDYKLKMVAVRFRCGHIGKIATPSVQDPAGVLLDVHQDIIGGKIQGLVDFPYTDCFKCAKEKASQ